MDRMGRLMDVHLGGDMSELLRVRIDERVVYIKRKKIVYL